ncbi:hypothetical protein DNH61_07255 [Paenibacillus sambharensis]|uniref:Uncharacterized protein n=1 Tax=Paenibacillus sambharensis TaxID=1803190 RepID=A0A2W1LBP2_9BACL|nr:hypothetical protein [Paenibacillus sambharensis]PZD96586.1 hypothetical protein DNH61_07255 [Paenibacillus sambharensis]
MTNGSNEIKTLDVKKVLDLANNKHIIDAFVTDEYNEQEIVVAIVARVRLADIKTNQGWKATVVDAKRSRFYDGVEIITESENRMASNATSLHLDTGTFYSDYEGYNVKKQRDYVKQNGKKSLDRYQQFYSEPIPSTEQ